MKRTILLAAAAFAMSASGAMAQATVGEINTNFRINGSPFNSISAVPTRTQ
jgi:catabolite regulation protein CreA